MQPPARSSQSAPDPLTLLAPAQPSGSQNSRLLFAFLGQGITYGLAVGAGWGALYGALFGTLIMPGIGTILGAIIGPIIGLCFGVVAGFVGGIALGLLTLLYFAPLGRARGYRLDNIHNSQVIEYTGRASIGPCCG